MQDKLKKEIELRKEEITQRDSSASFKRGEYLTYLLEKRKQVMGSIRKKEYELQMKREDLRGLNECICDLKGHSFTSWERHEDEFNRSCFYTRICNVCGFVERREYEPDDYRPYTLERKK